MIRRALLALFVVATPLGSQTPELAFHFSGEELSTAIKKAWNAPLPLVIAVVDGCRGDFLVASGPGQASVLGQKVSEAIRTALREAAEPIAQVDYAAVQESLLRDVIDPVVLCNHRTASWFLQDWKVDFVLLPRLNRLGDELLLQTYVIGVSDQKSVLRFTHRAPATPDLLALFNLVPEPPKAPAPKDEIPNVHRSGRDGVCVPSCKSCPNPEFTRVALEAKYAGSVVLRLAVSAEGRAERISVVRGAPFGLSQAAVDTVKKWLFKPATDIKGNPVAAWITVEVNFRQY